MHTVCTSFWACKLVTAAEQWLNRRGLLSFTFAYLSAVWYTSIMKNVNLNIVINITENKVDWNICRGKTRAKYSRFRYGRWTGEMTSSTRRGRQIDNLILRVFVLLDQRSENERLCMGAFSSPEAALLLVSTKNQDLLPGPTAEVRDSWPSRHSAHAQSHVWQIWLVLISIYCAYKAIQNRNVVGPGKRFRAVKRLGMRVI